MAGLIEFFKGLFIRFLELLISDLPHCLISYALLYFSLLFIFYIPIYSVIEKTKEHHYHYVIILSPILLCIIFHFSLRPKIKKHLLEKVWLQEVIRDYLNKVREDREKKRKHERELGPDPKFIPLSLRVRKKKSRGMCPPEADAPTLPVEEEEDWTSFRMENFLSPPYKRFTLVADSGMGKTTLLNELAFKIAREETSKGSIPCYFHFRDDLAGTHTQGELKKRIKDRRFKDIHHPQLDELINCLYEKGRFLFLLDGLDQTTSTDNLTNLLKNDGLLGNNGVIMAGRRWMYDKLDYTVGFSTDYQYVEIEPLNTRQIKEYLGPRYQDIVASGVGLDLLKVPILLHHIKFLPQGELSQIKTRTQLYDKLVGFLLKREWERGASLPDVTTTRTRFERLSYHTIQKGLMGRFPPTEIFPELTRLLDIRPEEFLVLRQLGIMSQIWEGGGEEGDIVFRHQSFQEYLASLELKKRIFPNEKFSEEALREHLKDKRWEEVIFFLIGSLEPAVSKEIISFISHFRYDFFFPAECIAHYKGNRDEDFRRTIDNLIYELFEHDVLSSPIRAQKVLAKIGTEYIFTKLVNALKEEHYAIRWEAAETLGRIGSEMAVEYLFPLLKDEEWIVREAAAWALGEIGSERAVEHLIPLLKDKDLGSVRRVAAEALGRCSKKLNEDALVKLVVNLHRETVS